jgi:hypothetical protein
MQRIVFFPLKMAWTDYDEKKKCRLFRTSEEDLAKFCANTEAWANSNGLRIVSISPISGATQAGAGEYGVVGTTTVGLLVVFEAVAAG